MSTEQSNPEQNPQHGAPANREPSQDGNRPRWSRFGPRTPTNPVARPSNGERGDRRGGGDNRGGRGR